MAQHLDEEDLQRNIESLRLQRERRAMASAVEQARHREPARVHETTASKAGRGLANFLMDVLVALGVFAVWFFGTLLVLWAFNVLVAPGMPQLKDPYLLPGTGERWIFALINVIRSFPPLTALVVACIRLCFRVNRSKRS